MQHLELSEEDATMLHQRYYKEYGLAIEGLVRHHQVDPLEYNEKVDNALPLDQILSPDPKLRQLLQDFDRTKVKLWLFTNAYVQHAERVIRLLSIEDQFEGVTFCDYAAPKLVCKPHTESFEKAEQDAGVESFEDCYFVGMALVRLERQPLTRQVDDSRLNCTHAQARGWTTVHKIEPEDPEPETRAAKHQIRSLYELRELFPHLFKVS